MCVCVNAFPLMSFALLRLLDMTRTITATQNLNLNIHFSEGDADVELKEMLNFLI